jgi:hypothetical protein
MHRSARRVLLSAATVTATTAALLLSGGSPAAAAVDPTIDSGVLRTVARNADVGFPTGQQTGAPAGIQTPEIRPEPEAESAKADARASAAAISPTGVPVVAATAVDGSPGLVRSFHALDGFDQRFANNGNQFSVEPPDQALCVGNGFVLEAVNDVLRVYRPTGAAASAVTDLNSFFRYPAAIRRDLNPVRFGPFVTDPTCLFDKGSNRWFVTVLTLDVDAATGAFTERNHIDIAVSRTANPLDGFAIYRLPVQDDGTQQTPKHAGCPCIGDYPHIAADAYGFYVTTNEYPFSDAPGVFGNNFNGAQIYAFDKAALAARAANVRVVQFSRTALLRNGQRVPGFTLAPAKVPDTAYALANNGTQYFLDSVASEEAQPRGFTGQADVIGVYALTNTKSLRNAQPSVHLSGALRPSERYVNPPQATQKLGPTPLADFCSRVDCTGFGPDPYAEGPIATNDSRMLQTYFSHGMLYGALNTGVQVNGQLHAGIAWFIVNPAGAPSGSSVAHQGYIGVAGANVMFPAVAAMTNGKGAMGFTLSGPSRFPTAAYAFVGPTGVTGAVNIAKAGVGPQDGFSEYFPVADEDSPVRPRWGDYGASVPVGSSIWLANEYIGQSCSFAEYQRDQTCGETRAPLINWGTRISAVTP